MTWTDGLMAVSLFIGAVLVLADVMTRRARNRLLDQIEEDQLNNQLERDRRLQWIEDTYRKLM
jgi:hypothetical protein